MVLAVLLAGCVTGEDPERLPFNDGDSTTSTNLGDGSTSNVPPGTDPSLPTSVAPNTSPADPTTQTSTTLGSTTSATASSPTTASSSTSSPTKPPSTSVATTKPSTTTTSSAASSSIASTATTVLTTTTVPTTTSTTTPAPVPVRLGVSPGGGIIGLDTASLSADLDAMAAMGLTRLRLDFDWSRIEPTEGIFNWTATDRIVSAADARGITVHGLITYTPTWARPAGTNEKHPPTSDADFASFSSAVVQRYRPRGVSSWEVWNEPNIPNFWSAPGGPDSGRYASLLTAAAVAIHRTDPAATVVTGGLAPAVDAAGVSIAPGTFLTRLFATMDSGVVQGVAIHPYSYPALPTAALNWNTFARLPEYKQIVAAGEGRALPIWITEFGAPTGSSSSAVSAADQEAIVKDALSCLTGVNWIGPVFLYNLRDRADGNANDVEDNFGLLRADWSPKPVVAVLQDYRIDPGSFSPGCTDW